MKTNTILIIYRSILLRMRNVSDKSCRENQNTYFMFSNFFFENCAIYGIMWKNIVQPGKPQTMWCAHIASWITKATNTWSKYVILFHCNNCCMKVPQCYTIHTLPASF